MARGELVEIPVEVSPPYPVVVGPGALGGAAERVEQERVAVVTDDVVGPLHLSRVIDTLEQAGKTVQAYPVPAGEPSKSMATAERVLREMARDGFDRDAAVLGLGGGVVTDLAGFVAAIYMRGVASYACPTTLLAMVDASVGGKTGVNLPEGKNLVGAFWQPRAVIVDPLALRTLPERAFRLGAVEHVKHGLLADRRLVDAIDDPAFRPDGAPAELADQIAASVRVKAEIVARDEKEAGVRAHLNLGHTLAHALEAASGHALHHGEAVAYGLLYAALLARARGWADHVETVRRLVSWVDPGPLPRAPFEDLDAYMARDKKARSGRIRFVLLEEVGMPRIVDDVSPIERERAWRELTEMVGGAS